MTVEVDITPHITHKELVEMGIVHFYEKEPMLILGQPGIGKTWTIINEIPKKIADNREILVYPLPYGMLGKVFAEPEKYFVVVPFHLSMIPVEDIAGVPFKHTLNVNGKNMTIVSWEPNPVIKLMSIPGIAGILFLDELLQADESKQAVALRIVLEKALVDVELSKDVWIVAASNRLSDVAGSNMPISPLIDRFSVCVLEPPTADEWIKNFATGRNDIHPYVISFLSRFPKYINTFDPNAYLENPEAPYATPRSWHKVGKLLMRLEQVVGKENKKVFVRRAEKIVSTRCGSGIGVEFANFIKNMDLPSIKEIFENPSIIRKYRDDPSIMYAITSNIIVSLSEIMKNTDKPKAYTKRTFDVLCEMPEEFVVLFISSIREKAYHVYRNIQSYIISDKKKKEHAELIDRIGRLVI